MHEVCSCGFPHSDISGSMDICSSPKLFAAYHVFHRLLVPRHPPCALIAWPLLCPYSVKNRRFVDSRFLITLLSMSSYHCVIETYFRIFQLCVCIKDIRVTKVSAQICLKGRWKLASIRAFKLICICDAVATEWIINPRGALTIISQIYMYAVFKVHSWLMFLSVI